MVILLLVVGTQPIVKLLNEMGLINLENITPDFLFGKTKVFVNGRWLGIHEEPKLLVQLLRLHRQNGLINIFTSISWSIKSMEISILTDSGRCCQTIISHGK